MGTMAVLLATPATADTADSKKYELVPSSASGVFSAILDLEAGQLLDLDLRVVGMSVADLRDFGPNATPFHIHLPNDGFSFTRSSMSIFAADQGKYKKAGVHPGDEVIGERLQTGFPFLLIHSKKDLFTNTKGKFPNGDPVPTGFPFGELRGEIAITN